MATLSHRIRRQRWLISTANKDEAFHLREKVRDEWEPAISSELEKAFNELAPNGNVIHLNAIEISLKVDEMKLKADPDGTRDEFNRQIREQLEFSLAGLLPGNDFPGSKSQSQFQLDHFLYYLHHGNLSWEKADLSWKELNNEFQDIIQGQSGQILETLHSNPLDPAVLFRLLQLLSSNPGTNSKFLTRLIPQDWGTDFYLLLKELISNDIAYPNLQDRLKLASEACRVCLENKNKSSIPDLSILFKNSSVHGENELLKFITALPLTSLFFPGIQDVADPNLFEDRKNRQIIDNDSQEKKAKILGTENSEFGLLVPNVGLILIHPFIEQLFESTGVILPGSKEISGDELPRAASILHFVATGEEEQLEFELGLIKVLLGLHPSDTLLVSAGLLRPSDMEESETLLNSAIEHWSALKNTSPEGFRQAFLQRNGILTETTEHWMLNMESKAFDMLLDQVPWSFSITRLPWMTKPIFTEWLTH